MTTERLLAFAAEQIRTISSHHDVRARELADAFRREFGLGPFPRLPNLLQASREAGITVEFRDDLPLDGVNGWGESGPPLISLNAGLPFPRKETTLAHELREVIENAFKRADPDYAGLTTHDNRRMNPESDDFGGALLMESVSTRMWLEGHGYDYVAFARASERSIASVVVRAQQLFPANSGPFAPVAALWLYEAPWSEDADRWSAKDRLEVTQLAHLNGFTTGRASPRGMTAAAVFPRRGSLATQAAVVLEAISGGRVSARVVGGFDLFRELDYTVVAEPLGNRIHARQLLLTAVRNDALPFVAAWFERLSIRTPQATFQRL